MVWTIYHQRSEAIRRSGVNGFSVNNSWEKMDCEWAKIADQSELQNSLSPKTTRVNILDNWIERVCLAKHVNSNSKNSNVTECLLSATLVLSKQIVTTKRKHNCPKVVTFSITIFALHFFFCSSFVLLIIHILLRICITQLCNSK